ncbi:protein lethal(2)essential for life-like [Hylaeus anthracinus]|uniref:protein lethal(2)essential for life-like n=1 Tax=Hylaeus anthracinus TaxID=313031 RepID=UPI0023B8949F|nr:protein lethal(2)essential for life-like [Hylaeus anthracinus]
MSLIPLLYSDWWESLDKPHHLWDQNFGTTIDLDSLLDEPDPFASELLLYRPHRHMRRRYHPFPKKGSKSGRGVSTVQADKDKFQVTLDVSQYLPEEVTVKLVDRNVVVEAKHEEREDEHGWISRKFVRKYIIPSQCDVDRVESHLSSDGILSITAPRMKPAKPETTEKVLKIHYTGKPALANSEDQVNGTPEPQKEQQSQQRVQQQQPQQQTHQRGRKGTHKNV